MTLLEPPLHSGLRFRSKYVFLMSLRSRLATDVFVKPHRNSGPHCPPGIARTAPFLHGVSLVMFEMFSYAPVQLINPLHALTRP